MTRFTTLIKSTLILFAGAALFVSLTGCDSGGANEEEEEEPSIDNTFSFTITPTGSGAAKATAEDVDGFAFFAEGQDPETEQEAFVMYFSDQENFSSQSTQEGLFGLVARLASRPGTGTYSVSDIDDEIESGSAFVMVLYENIQSQSPTYYVADGGSIEITESSGTRIGAEVDITAVQFSFDSSTNQSTSTPVTITGTITAKSVETFLGISPFMQ